MAAEGKATEFEQPIDIAEGPLVDLMPWPATSDQLYLAATVCRAIDTINGSEGTHKLLGSTAAEAVMLPLYIHTMKADAWESRSGALHRAKPHKSKGGHAKGGRVTPKLTLPANAGTTPDLSIYGHDEIRHMCNLATDAFALDVDVARAVAGETGPLKDAQPWGEDTLPPKYDGRPETGGSQTGHFCIKY